MDFGRGSNKLTLLMVYLVELEHLQHEFYYQHIGSQLPQLALRQNKQIIDHTIRGSWYSIYSRPDGMQRLRNIFDVKAAKYFSHIEVPFIYHYLGLFHVGFLTDRCR